MKAPSQPANEVERLRELRSYDVLDTAREPAFDRITSLASTLFDVPIALVSLVDEARQWFKSSQGLGASETPRDISFCGHAILDDAPLVVPNVLTDERFVDNPLVTGAPDIRFYAGAPLVTPRGFRIGTLCVIDRKPRELTPLQEGVLRDLAALVVDQLELRSARAAQERETQELRQLLSDLPMPVVVVAEGIIRFANQQAEQLLGYGAGELQGVAQIAIVHPDEQGESLRTAESTLQEGTRSVHRRLARRDGEIRTVEGSAARMAWSGRSAVVVLMRDVTRQLWFQEQQEAAAALVSGELMLMLSAFDVMPDGLILFDPSFRCAYANKAMGTIFGLPHEVLKGWTPDDAAKHIASLTGTPLAVTDPGRLRGVTASASEGIVYDLLRPVPRVVRRTLHALMSPTHPFISVWHDITHEASELAKREEEAMTDALTRLPNRRAMESRLERARSTGGRSTLAMFDVDHFKRVNDTYGHDAGDEVLRRVAAALKASARDGNHVARWGGEEFIALLRTDLSGARRFAERVRQAVEALATPAGPVTLSCGLADLTGENPIREADGRLYEAKHRGRNRVCG